MLGKIIGTFFPPALQMCSYASSFLPEHVLLYGIKNHIHKAATHHAYFKVCPLYVYGVGVCWGVCMRFSGLILGEILGVIQDYLGIVGKNYWDNFFRRPCKCVHMHPLFFLSVCFRTASRIISIRPLPTALTSESVHGMFMEWRNNTKSFSNI